MLGSQAYGSNCFRRRARSLWATVGVFVAALCAAGLAPVRALTISAVRENVIVFVRGVAPGECFIHHSIHSVELSPVQEFFRIDENCGITLYETAFRSSNVGLPYAAFGREVFLSGPGGFRITNMNRPIPELLIWSDARYDNRLILGGQNWPLYAFKGNTLLRVAVGNLPYIYYLFLRLAVHEVTPADIAPVHERPICLFVDRRGIREAN